MDTSVVPAIIPQTLAHLRASVLAIADVASMVQIDIVDGEFVPFTSWPYGGHPSELQEFIAAGGLLSVAPMSYGLDLMVDTPEATMEQWLSLGAERIILHIESTHTAPELIEQIHGAGKQAGLALSNDTPLTALEPYVHTIDLVQCMGIADIGQQGEPFDERVIERIRTLHEHYPKLPISVDGGVNKDTITTLRDAGATRFVSGSAIFGAADPQHAYDELTTLAAGV